MNISKHAKFLTAIIAVATSLSAGAADTTDSNPFLGALSAATSAELPAKAAKLVSQTEAKVRPQATVDVVKSAVGLNPAAAPLIVGSIAQATPDMAATAAGTAVSLVPDQAVTIARVAAAAAPAKAGKIVQAICHVLPKQYKAVAIAVAEVVPGREKEILAGIASAMPEFQKAINQAQLAYSGDVPSVSAVLTQVAKIQGSTDTASLASGASATAGLPARGPSQGAPFVPLSGTPAVTTPSDNGQTPNPVNYSAP